MPDAQDVTSRILTRCRELGFALAGVCDAQPSDHRDEYRAWIAAGKHGEMGYLARNVDLRLDPRELVRGATSIICVADRYHVETPKRQSGETTTRRSPEEERAFGRIARYARGDDYHTSMKKRLHIVCDELRAEFPGETFRACVDTAPLLEREHAQRAGLGAVGKHTLLIERGVGSYLFLGGVVTTLALTPSAPADPDPCGSCTRCIDACPTDAITPWSIDATKCISYLTIEHRSEIESRFHEAIGDWLFGCDICQEVCPHNQRTRSKRRIEVNPTYAPQRDGFDLLEILGWSEDDRRVEFRTSALKRATLAMMKRNAAICLENGDEESR